MAAIRKFLTDEQWAKIEPLLPSEKPGSQARIIHEGDS
jgi:transposase